MSLDYSLKAIDNYKALYTGSDEVGYNIKEPYQTAIFNMMVIDMMEITEKTFDEALFRSLYFKRVMCKSKLDNETFTRTYEVLRRLMGLRTNVYATTRNQFIRKLNQVVVEEVQRGVRTWWKQKEVEAASGS